MKNKFIEFLKGILIGIGNVMPGFSGGTMAVAFNVYDKIINAISNFIIHPIEIIKSIWVLAFGIAVGIAITIFGISILLENFPIPTILLFTGLIVGSIPSMFGRIKTKKYKLSHLLAFLFGIFIIIGFPLIGRNTETVQVLDINIGHLIILFLLGVVASASMIIPGVSGSLILLALGYYQYIIDFIKEFMKAVLEINFEGIFDNLILVISLGLGIVVGAILISKLIEILLKKYPIMVYTTIVGLLVASPFAIIYQMYDKYETVINEAMIFNWIVGILFLALGVFAADYITKYEQRHQKPEIE